MTEKEITGPAWFVTALCAIVMVTWIFGKSHAVAPAFYCFLPVVFFQMTSTIRTLSQRVEELERERGEQAT